MSFRTTIFVLGFTAPSAICLIYAWVAWVKSRVDPIKYDWRARLLVIALALASLSQFLATAFLLNGLHSDRQSFAERVSLAWGIANWTTLLAWVLALVIAALGKGTTKWLVLVWGLVLPAGAWIIIMIGYDY